MNIIDYKINEEKLQEMVEKAYERNLIDKELIMNSDTLKALESQYWEQILHKCNLNNVPSYYCGILIKIDNELKFGEVKLYGFEEKECTRVTCYKDDSAPKVEVGVKDKIFVCIE